MPPPTPTRHGPARGTIHTLRLRLSNVHLAVGPETVLFDTGSPGEETRILRWIADLGLPPPRTIILTHAHADHAGSAAALRRMTGARLCLAPEDWQMAQTGRNRTLRPVRLSAYPLTRLVPARFEPFSPDLPLDGSVAMAELGLHAELLATPGHTAGSVSLVFPDGQAVVGDLMMGGYIGGHLRPRRPRAHYFADAPADNAASLSRLMSHGARILHTGHGGPLHAKDIKDLTP
jgi:glyoxylase-like metal-dependent hydrolase (beta-lactamase superfamily II)